MTHRLFSNDPDDQEPRSKKPLKLKRPKRLWPTTAERLIRAKPRPGKGSYKLQAPKRSIF